MIKFLLTLISLFVFTQPVIVLAQTNRATLWPVQSVDTMKYSRDLAREKLNEPLFDSTIKSQLDAIASTGATHVAIATPYDEEFLPFLTRWVKSARLAGLKIWFRGNWSGWEDWFNYPKISRSDHLTLTHYFILKHSDLFADGDIFSACPECENGGPGDPRITRDISGYRKFLLDLDATSSAAFASINKQVTTNYYSSNGDVARLIMDPATTKALGGVICIDHYVATPEKLVQDIKSLISSSGAKKVILGEFGVPIPDINGYLTPDAQANWLNKALPLLAAIPEVAGINYWTSFGSSTSLWDNDGQSRLGALVLTHFYTPRQIIISVSDYFSKPLPNIKASYSGHEYRSDVNGIIRLPYVSDSDQVQISSSSYQNQGLFIGQNTSQFSLTLTPRHENLLYRLHKLTYNIIHDILHL